MQNPANTTVPKVPLYEGIDSYAFEPAVALSGERTCRAGHVPVYRAFRGATKFPDDPNHRFTTNYSTYQTLVAAGWSADGIKMCVPQAGVSQAPYHTLSVSPAIVGSSFVPITAEYIASGGILYTVTYRTSDFQQIGISVWFTDSSRAHVSNVTVQYIATRDNPYRHTTYIAQCINSTSCAETTGVALNLANRTVTLSNTTLDLMTSSPSGAPLKTVLNGTLTF